MFAPDATARVEAARDALRLARRTGDPALVARALGVAWAAGDGIAPRAEQVERAREWVEASGGASGGVFAVVPLVRLWTEHVAIGAFDDARAGVDVIDRIADQTQWGTARWYVDLLRGYLAVLEGDLATARASARTLSSTAARPGPGTVVSQLSLEQRIAELSGDADGVERCVREVAARSMLSTRAYLADARAASRAGEHREATVLVDTWVERVLVRAPAFVRAYLASADAELVARHGSRSSVLDVLSIVSPLRNTWTVANLVVPLWRYELASGLLLLSLGDVDAAVADLSAAHAGHVAAHAHGVTSVSGAALAEALRVRGRPQDEPLIAALS